HSACPGQPPLYQTALSLLRQPEQSLFHAHDFDGPAGASANVSGFVGFSCGDDDRRSVPLASGAIGGHCYGNTSQRTYRDPRKNHCVLKRLANAGRLATIGRGTGCCVASDALRIRKERGMENTLEQITNRPLSIDGPMTRLFRAAGVQ